MDKEVVVVGMVEGTVEAVVVGMVVVVDTVGVVVGVVGAEAVVGTDDRVEGVDGDYGDKVTMVILAQVISVY
jgi:hypothetical protein